MNAQVIEGKQMYRIGRERREEYRIAGERGIGGGEKERGSVYLNEYIYRFMLSHSLERAGDIARGKKMLVVLVLFFFSTSPY